MERKEIYREERKVKRDEERRLKEVDIEFGLFLGVLRSWLEVVLASGGSDEAVPPRPVSISLAAFLN